MRILFLTSRLPYPPDRGDRLRVFNFIKSLSRQHEIHLISFYSNNEELSYQSVLRKYCKEMYLQQRKPTQSLVGVIFNIWRDEPLQSLYYRSSDMMNLVNRVLSTQKFDALYVHLFRMAQYVENHVGIYRILDLTDVISKEISRSLPYRNFLSRLVYSFEYRRIRKYELDIIKKYDEVWLISKSDQSYLETQYIDANVRVVTNGIDIEKFHPTCRTPIQHRILFIGHMGVFHNVDAVQYFAREIFPLVQEEYPDSTFIIAGSEPAPSVIDLSTLPNIQVLGYIEDLNSELNSSHIFIAPLRFAAGVQNKVLEAMAAGVPVITTGIVNEGLNALPGKEIIVADQPEEFTQSIYRLFQDKTLRNEIGLSGMNFVHKNFSWDIVLKRVNYIESTLSNR